MVTTHNLGFPRIGAKRELKFGLESYWRGQSSRDELNALGRGLRARHWNLQKELDLAPVGDFSFYDHVLDMSFTLGNIPVRFRDLHGDQLDNYFRVARGRSAESAEAHAQCCGGVSAGEMTKWFDTNYHYIVPEFNADTQFILNATRLLEQLAEAEAQNVKVKPVIIGPVTYLAIGKAKDGSDKLALLPQLLQVYAQLLENLAVQGVEWVQIDEPILVTELDVAWQHAFNIAYHQLKNSRVKLLLATYFGQLADNQYLAVNLPVAGLHIDAINGRNEILPLVGMLPGHKVLSLGVINGRNIWKTNLNATLDWLEPLAERLGNRLWIAPSCSLLHVPVDLDSEQKLDVEVKSSLAFAKQKLEELLVLAMALNQGREAVKDQLASNQAAIEARRNSKRVHNPSVKAALEKLTPKLGQRQNVYAQRAAKQASLLKLPKYPTTTIGSFPQTDEIRQARSQFKSGALDQEAMRSP